MPKIRINRALALAGVASRRKSEHLVLAGKVSVNNVVVKDLATTVDPHNDAITVSGILVTKPTTLSPFATPIILNPAAQAATLA